MGKSWVDAGASGCGEGSWWAGKRWTVLACGVAAAACVVAAAVVVPVILSGAEGGGGFASDTRVEAGCNASYYSGVGATLRDRELILSLHDTLSSSARKPLSYRETWAALEVLDSGQGGCGPQKVSDIYSKACWLASHDRCGKSVSKAGQCYNREHSWPKSWWGGFDQGQGATTDLVGLFLVDGKLNSKRRNNPFGEVGKVLEEWPSKARIGYCRDWQGKCFEPPDEFKGDLARAHFYLSVRYAGVWECCETKVTNRTAVSTLAESTLRRWHRQDPVSERERRRNDLIHSRFQGTRNPFVDCPTFEARIQDF